MPHTPGPWTSSKRAGMALHRWHVAAKHYSRPGVVDGRDSIAEIMSAGSPEECEANARLIAAAPELLEALKGLAADVEKIARDSFSTVGGDFEFDYRYEDPDGYAVWSAARTAIAKAEGRA